VIKSVKDKGLLSEFISYPENLYRDDPDWVRPLVGRHINEFSPRTNPALSKHEIELYLAFDGEKIKGRAAAFTDRMYNSIHREATAFFGFYECEDDDRISGELFSAVESFAKNKGMKKVTGPVDFSTNYQAGFLVDGFGKPTVMTPYNKKYYPRQAESAGYTKCMDLYSYNINYVKNPIRVDSEKTFRILGKRYPEMKIVSLDNIKGCNKTTLLKDLFNRCFADNWGFVPITGEEIVHLYKTLKSLGHTALNYILLSGRKPAGLLLTVPDLYSGSASTGGDSHSTGGSNLRVTILGVLPNYRRRGWETLMGVKMLDDSFARGYENIEFSVILENNTAMNNLARRKFGVEPVKTFRVYEKLI